MHIILPLSFLLYSPNAYAGGGFVNGSVNLLIFVIVIAVLARKPVSKMLELRAATIKRNIAQAQELLEESQKKNAEITAQLENLTAEMEKMRSDADTQIENMKKDIERKAQEDIEAIRQNAKRSVQDELARAQQQLKKETAQAALELAEEIIKQQIETQDQQRLFASFTQAVEEAPNV